ncbi:undecaprenyl-phosphate glucose phosphotransferase [Pseudohoeflea coraliihabitans]|uniref:Undecaprenyl-phosphate glucose phosphotransferase n=1 Tax=Pseudohoeflea coraliihabitans TaxID=2860393 RepID=A0ABS6WS64_9HYPH|nr:undecaprenyl-phosphate glucose phosphotransferase [Pseudohoeflea sp. DP4N28-3]MBW3098788.1 undecaprenyl-phosphate glucose phosphotransferase [Pseudohoeflea sp. DP4N28-3]
MNEINSPAEFDRTTLREAVRTPSADGGSGKPAGAESLNRVARQTARRLAQESYSPSIITGLLRLAEFLLMALVGAGIYAFYVGLSGPTSAYYAPAIVLGAALSVLGLQIADGYQVPALRAGIKFFPRVIVAVTAAFAVLTVSGFFLQYSVYFSRFWAGSWLVGGIAALFFWRLFVAFAIRRWARNGVMERRAVIVGGGTLAESLIRSIEHDPSNDIRICGIFDDRSSRRSPEVVAGYPKLGTVDELVAFARLARMDMLIIALPLKAEARVLELLKTLWVLPLDIRLAAHADKLRFRPRSYSYAGAAPLLDIFDRPITDWDSVAKRIFDVFFSLLAIALLWPVMLATAIAIKATSKGPVLFKQKRHGFNNEEVEVYKFRSMYTEQSDPTALQQVTKDDPRVTPVGRFIRKTSIDELPQFFNVLLGSLSLVGPRPHAVAAGTHDRQFTEVVDGYFARHRVKPGVTGWAQINGWRGEIDCDDKIRQRTAYDLYYIENWSLLFDLRILFLTPFRLFDTENAY